RTQRDDQKHANLYVSASGEPCYVVEAVNNQTGSNRGHSTLDDLRIGAMRSTGTICTRRSLTKDNERDQTRNEVHLDVAEPFDDDRRHPSRRETSTDVTGHQHYVAKEPSQPLAGQAAAKEVAGRPEVNRALADALGPRRRPQAV